jgi:AcrR family transcriptional regulator
VTAILNQAPESSVADRILEIAKEIIDSVGEAGLRIDEVMDRADVKAPVIYRHFGSREGLVQSAHLARYADSFRSGSTAFGAAARAARSQSEFRLAVDALIDAAFDETHIEARLVRLEVLAMGTARPELASAIRALQDENRQWFVQGLEFARQLGWVRSDLDMHEFIEWATSTTLGLAAVSQFRTEPETARQWIRYQRAAIHTALFGDEN